MNEFDSWVTLLFAVLLLPNVAASADAAKEAYEKGNGDLSEAIRLDPKYALAYHSRSPAGR